MRSLARARPPPRTHTHTHAFRQDKESADPTRVGGPINPLLKDGGLSTMITGGKGVDKGLTSSLQRMQARTDSGGGDRSLVVAFREIARLCSDMSLQDVVRHQANEYYKEAHEKSRSVRGRGQAAVHAAVVFMACRQQNIARTFKELCAYAPQASKKARRRREKGEWGCRAHAPRQPWSWRDRCQLAGRALARAEPPSSCAPSPTSESPLFHPRTAPIPCAARIPP